MSNYPKYMRHYEPTLRSFRARKRYEVRRVEEALGDLLTGCAHTPAKDLGVALDIIRKAKEAMSVKNWGRGENC